MSKASQSALLRYKARREGRPFAAPNPAPAGPRRLSWAISLAVIVLTVAVVTAGIWFAVTREPAPLALDYEIDLSHAPQGSLALKLVIGGDLPRHLDLVFPPGVFGDRRNGVDANTPTAYALTDDDRPGRSLAIERIDDGWRLSSDGTDRAGFEYRIDLSRPGDHEEDIRRYISTLVNGGVRVAGFEVFLAPAGHRIKDITVAIRNPHDMPVLAPWSTLVRGHEQPGAGIDSVSLAHLSTGQSYLSADLPTGGAAPRHVEAALAHPADHFYHPRDLSDLNNSLLICGDLRTASTRARDCIIQFATDRRWQFADDEALDLVRRIARTELGFFGSSPSPRITVLLAANEVSTPDGFDTYGVHTGSSVLVMIDPGTTWGELEEQAASVIAHEMFHGWLGEAIPQTDPMTLWFTEGVTTWYAARMLTAAGIWSPDHARRMLTARLERDYDRNALKGVRSVADAAAAVMSNPEEVRFAYAGGVTVCASLDAWLARHASMDRPLDGVLRHLYEHRSGEPLSRAGIEAAVLEVTGVDCSAWLDHHAYGKTALPLPDDLI